MPVDVRELHDHTGELIREVAESGSVITVMMDGKRVARIVPVDVHDQAAELRHQKSIREGRGSGRPLAPPIKLRNGATVSDLIGEQRR